MLKIEKGVQASLKRERSQTPQFASIKRARKNPSIRASVHDNDGSGLPKTSTAQPSPRKKSVVIDLCIDDDSD